MKHVADELRKWAPTLILSKDYAPKRYVHIQPTGELKEITLIVDMALSDDSTLHTPLPSIYRKVRRQRGVPSDRHQRLPEQPRQAEVKRWLLACSSSLLLGRTSFRTIILTMRSLCALCLPVYLSISCLGCSHTAVCARRGAGQTPTTLDEVRHCTDQSKNAARPLCVSFPPLSCRKR